MPKCPCGNEFTTPFCCDCGEPNPDQAPLRALLKDCQERVKRARTEFMENRWSSHAATIRLILGTTK